jgi:hypothetical protein
MTTVVPCEACGTVFTKRHSQSRYCSPECARAGARKSWREYGARNREARRAYHRQHYQENAEKVATRVGAYRHTDAGKRAQRTNDERQREKFPERYAARQAVLVALRQGILVKGPCARAGCGATKTQAHHPDYSKPLDVVWLCSPHHREEHCRSNSDGTVGVLIEDGAVVEATS